MDLKEEIKKYEKDINKLLEEKEKNQKDLICNIITLVFIVPLMLANVWFLQQIWNNGICMIFSLMPIITYKVAFAIYFLKSMFNLTFQSSTIINIDRMFNKDKSLAYISCVNTFVTTFAYLVTWIIITKIIF
jgi:hypothetical protein